MCAWRDETLTVDISVCCGQVEEREEQVLRLQAEAVALRSDVKARCVQLDSSDEALATLSQRLRDTQRELELSRVHAQECELVISTLRDNTTALRRQVTATTALLHSNLRLFLYHLANQ